MDLSEDSSDSSVSLEVLKAVFDGVQSGKSSAVQYDVAKLIEFASRHPAEPVALLWQRTVLKSGYKPTEMEAKKFQRDVDIIRASHNHAICEASRWVNSLQVASDRCGINLSSVANFRRRKS